MNNQISSTSEHDQKRITVLVVEPEKQPYVKEIDPGLASLQREVGGFIEAVYPYREPVALICDEEGKLKRSPLNRALRDEDNYIYDIIAGTFLITGLHEDNFASLSPELIKQFSQMFRTPELFLNMGNKIVVLPMKEEPVKDKKPSVVNKLKDLKDQTKPLEHIKPHVKEER